MNSVAFAKVVALGLILSAAVVGCKKGAKTLTHIPSSRTTMPGPDPSDLASGIGTTPQGDPIGTLPERFDESKYDVDSETFRQQTVYFELDSSTVRAAELSKVQAVAAHLRSNAAARVRIEGHCDERGTDGYNLALGERRAQSAREQLVAAGVSWDRVSTKSWGEDKPAVLGSDEGAFSKNRRAEFMLLTPKQ